MTIKIQEERSESMSELPKKHHNRAGREKTRRF